MRPNCTCQNASVIKVIAVFSTSWFAQNANRKDLFDFDWIRPTESGSDLTIGVAKFSIPFMWERYSEFDKGIPLMVYVCQDCCNKIRDILDSGIEVKYDMWRI